MTADYTRSITFPRPGALQMLNAIRERLGIAATGD
jgi:hypothetical protein